MIEYVKTNAPGLMRKKGSNLVINTNNAEYERIKTSRNAKKEIITMRQDIEWLKKELEALRREIECLK